MYKGTQSPCSSSWVACCASHSRPPMLTSVAVRSVPSESCRTSCCERSGRAQRDQRRPPRRKVLCITPWDLNTSLRGFPAHRGSDSGSWSSPTEQRFCLPLTVFRAVHIVACVSRGTCWRKPPPRGHTRSNGPSSNRALFYAMSNARYKEQFALSRDQAAIVDVALGVQINVAGLRRMTCTLEVSLGRF